MTRITCITFTCKPIALKRFSFRTILSSYRISTTFSVHRKKCFITLTTENLQDFVTKVNCHTTETEMLRNQIFTSGGEESASCSTAPQVYAERSEDLALYCYFRPVFDRFHEIYVHYHISTCIWCTKVMYLEI